MIRLPPKIHRAVLACREADAKFFARRRDRQHRVRLAARAEIVLARSEGTITLPVPAGVRGFVACERRLDEALHWVIGFEPEHTNTDLDERAAHAAYLQFLQHDDAKLCDLAERVRTGGANA